MMISLGLMPWALAVLLAQVDSVTVKVFPTSEEPFAAELRGLSPTLVQLESDAKLREIPVEKLRRLTFNPAGSTTAGNGSSDDSRVPLPTEAKLSDGSKFSFQTVVTREQEAEFELSSELGIALPLSTLNCLKLQSLNEAQQGQWQVISQSRHSSDTLVLIRSPETLEKIEGVILAITPDAVRFEFSGTSIDAPLSKLAGVCFFHPAGRVAEDDKKLSAIVHDQGGNRWLAASLSSTADGQAAKAAQMMSPQSLVSMELLCGAKLAWPLEWLREIDYSSGSVQFLADMQPLRTETRKRLELGLHLPQTDAVFGPRPSQWHRLGEAALGASVEFLGSGSSQYRVPPGFSRLVGSVELRPVGSHGTPCRVALRSENKVLWEKRLEQPGRPIDFDLPVEADARLTLDVEAEAEVPVGDVVLWHQIRLVK